MAKRRTIAELGENKIRDLVVSHLAADPEELLGYGDDAVAFRLGGKMLLVVHTDSLVGSTDAPRSMPPFYIGWKAVIMNLSDIASKGAKPLSLLFSWAIPRSFSPRYVSKIAQGMDAAARKYGTYVTGGDTGEADDLVLAGTSLGIIREDLLMRRDGARPGDILAVTGEFGLTSVGYKILLEDFDAPRAIRRDAIKAIYAPTAKVKEGLAVAKTHGVTACMDCSDGLGRSLHLLSKMSNVGFRVSKIPIAGEASRFASIHQLDEVKLALYQGGEEYELVLCVRGDAWRKVSSAVKASGGRLSRIGEVTSDRKLRLESEDGSVEKIEDVGWQHFLRWAQPRTRTG